MTGKGYRMDIVATTGAPKAIGPYSQAVAAGEFVFTAGQIALHPESMDVVGTDVAQQTEQVMRNLAAVLEAGGSSLSRVVKTTVYLSSMGDFPTMNEVYAKHFGAHRPARSTVEAAALPKNVRVEIDAIALRG